MMKGRIFFRKEKNLQFLFQKRRKNRNKNGGRNMKNTKVYVDFITEKLKKLLSIDSPTGYTKDAIAWLKAEYEAMG